MACEKSVQLKEFQKQRQTMTEKENDMNKSTIIEKYVCVNVSH